MLLENYHFDCIFRSLYPSPFNPFPFSILLAPSICRSKVKYDTMYSDCGFNEPRFGVFLLASFKICSRHQVHNYQKSAVRLGVNASVWVSIVRFSLWKLYRFFGVVAMVSSWFFFWLQHIVAMSCEYECFVLHTNWLTSWLFLRWRYCYLKRKLEASTGFFFTIDCK